MPSNIMELLTETVEERSPLIIHSNTLSLVFDADMFYEMLGLSVRTNSFSPKALRLDSHGNVVVELEVSNSHRIFK